MKSKATKRTTKKTSMGKSATRQKQGRLPYKGLRLAQGKVEEVGAEDGGEVWGGAEILTPQSAANSHFGQVAPAASSLSSSGSLSQHWLSPRHWLPHRHWLEQIIENLHGGEEGRDGEGGAEETRPHLIHYPPLYFTPLALIYDDYKSKDETSDEMWVQWMRSRLRHPSAPSPWVSQQPVDYDGEDDEEAGQLLSALAYMVLGTDTNGNGTEDKIVARSRSKRKRRSSSSSASFPGINTIAGRIIVQQAPVLAHNLNLLLALNGLLEELVSLHPRTAKRLARVGDDLAALWQLYEDVLADVTLTDLDEEIDLRSVADGRIAALTHIAVAPKREAVAAGIGGRIVRLQFDAGNYLSLLPLGSREVYPYIVPVIRYEGDGYYSVGVSRHRTRFFAENHAEAVERAWIKWYIPNRLGDWERIRQQVENWGDADLYTLETEIAHLSLLLRGLLVTEDARVLAEREGAHDLYAFGVPGVWFFSMIVNAAVVARSVVWGIHTHLHEMDIHIPSGLWPEVEHRFYRGASKKAEQLLAEWIGNEAGRGTTKEGGLGFGRVLPWKSHEKGRRSPYRPNPYTRHLLGYLIETESSDTEAVRSYLFLSHERRGVKDYVRPVARLVVDREEDVLYLTRRVRNNQQTTMWLITPAIVHLDDDDFIAWAAWYLRRHKV